MSTSWGQNSWGANQWGDQDAVDVSLTGLGLTTAIGAVDAFNEAGWGSDAWGDENWGESATDVTLSTAGVATTAVGSFPYAQSETGWGRDDWGEAGWGVDYSVLLTGLGATSGVGAIDAFPVIDVPISTAGVGTTAVGGVTSEIVVPITAPSNQGASGVGELSETSTNAGWGRDTWGQEPWGDTDEPVVTLDGQQVTSAVGSVEAFNEQGWGKDTWGFENWGESALTVIVDVDSSGVATSSVGAISPIEMSIGLAGQVATSSLGTPGLLFGTGDLSLGTAGVGTTAVGALTAADVVGISGVSASTAVGSISPADVVGITGVSATSSVGSIEVTETQLIIIGSDGVTTPAILNSAVGAIIPEIGVPITGLAATSAVGEISPQDVVGLEGQEATSEIGTTGFGTIGYKDIDITGNTSYTDVNHAA
jgi:hypothetical protein